MAPSRSLLFGAVLLFLNTYKAMSSCYWADGSLWNSSDALKLVPCDPNANVTPCCNSPNYCLDNGLCLNTNTGGTGNNLFSIQGCTDPSWPSPCHKYCQSQNPRDSVDMVECQPGPGYDYYCCGEDVSCCSNTVSLVKIAAATSVGSPGGQTSTTSILTSTPTSSTSSATSSTTALITAQPSSKPSSNGRRSTVIGLGVGIPLGLLCIMVIAFLGWQLKKSNDLKREPFRPEISAVGY